jgi:hypothetical protein
MDESTIAAWERGDHQPIENSIRIAEAFFRSNRREEKREVS